MPKTRLEIPWKEIQQEVVSAVIESITAEAKEQQGFRQTPYRPLVAYVNRIADFIRANETKYPVITKDASIRCIRSRVAMSMNKMNWAHWTTKAGMTGKKFVIPWEKVLP